MAAIATFLTDADTKPPLTLSIEGEWGSGKSSFMKQIRKKIADDAQGRVKPKMVWFNAWRHDQHEALWATFALKFLEEISKGSILYKATTWFKLISRRANWRQWPDIIRILCLDLFFIVIIGSLPVVFIASWRGDLVAEIADEITCYLSPNKSSSPSPNTSSSSPKSSSTTPSCESSAINRLLNHLLLLGGAGGSTAGVFYLITTILKSPIHDPKHDLKAYLDSPNYEKRVAFIEQFHQDFDKIVDVYAGKDRTGAPNKIYVFIDDIDRCELTKAAELMQAVYLMTADNPHIIFILGMDRQKLAASIALRQKAILPYLQSSSGYVNDGATESQKLLQGLDYGYSFIEKFVQLPFQVPLSSSDSNNLNKFFEEILKNQQESSNSSQGSVDSSTAENDGKSSQNLSLRHNLKDKLKTENLIKIGEMVAPALDYNPRRLKLFINLLRLKAYIAWNTGFKPEENLENDGNSQPSQTLTLEQLGKFTAITLRWPLLLADLAREEQLLTDLQRFAIADESEEVRKETKAGSAQSEEVRKETEAGSALSEEVREETEAGSAQSEDYSYKKSKYQHSSEHRHSLVEKWKREQKLLDFLKKGCLQDRANYSLEDINIIRKLLEVSPRYVASLRIENILLSYEYTLPELSQPGIDTPPTPPHPHE